MPDVKWKLKKVAVLLYCTATDISVAVSGTDIALVPVAVPADFHAKPELILAMDAESVASAAFNSLIAPIRFFAVVVNAEYTFVATAVAKSENDTA